LLLLSLLCSTIPSQGVSQECMGVYDQYLAILGNVTVDPRMKTSVVGNTSGTNQVVSVTSQTAPSHQVIILIKRNIDIWELSILFHGGF